MVVLGVYPKLVLDRILPSVVHLLAHVHATGLTTTGIRVR
jgi:NADH:ubiquinone oxidoreductase subunit 4 (subunit M)